MTSIPILTIAIPTYNRGVWLDKLLAILEIELRTLADISSIEILVSNNYSTDSTADVINKFRHNPKFIFTEQSSNIGAVKNIAFLTRKAKGRYLWVLGDDDFPFKGFLSKLVALMHKNYDSSLFFVEMNIWYPNKEINNQTDLENGIQAYYQIDYTSADLHYVHYNEMLSIADPVRGYFNAIGNIILLTEDYKIAFSNTGNVENEFTSLDSIFPHSCYIARNLMYKPCVHVVSQGIFCSHNVSWKRFYDITYLKWYPELFILMAKNGADRKRADTGRRELFIRYPAMIDNIINKTAGNYKYFSWKDFIKNNYMFLEFWKLLVKIGLKRLKLYR